MNKIEEILRLRHELDLSQTEISLAAKVSQGTVSNVLRAAASAGVGWPLPDDLTGGELRTLIYPPKETVSGARLEPDWAALAGELNRSSEKKEEGNDRKARVTREALWDEHRDAAGDLGLKAYGRTRFFELLAEYISGPGAEPEMRFDYLPGDWGMSDFSGKTLKLTTPEGLRNVEIFVCVLGHSRMIFAAAVADQKLESWVAAHDQAFRYFGGVPRHLIIDNLKAGVTRWDHKDPELNLTFSEFARHYGFAIMPARPYEPRDKGMAESAVKTVQTRILVPLRKTGFMTLADMNIAIRDKLDSLNRTIMKSFGVSRLERFETGEKDQLLPLPAVQWELARSVTRKVATDYHVDWKCNYYSVPHKHVGQQVRLRYTERTVEIMTLETGEVIAVHRRSHGRNHKLTEACHMPEAHAEMARQRSPDHQQWLMSELGKLGPGAAAWAEGCLASRDFPSQAYRTLRGALRLAETHGAAAFNDACNEALFNENYTSGFLRDWLKDAAVRERPDPIPDHANIRGSSCYSRTGEAS